MEIEVEIHRKDLVALNLYILPRARETWIGVAILATSIFAFLLIAERPASVRDTAVAAFASVIGGLAGVLAGYLFGVLWILLALGSRSGVLGKHLYTLTDAGFREVTDANESLQKWSGIQEIIKLPSCILFRINGYLFHIVPRRAFSDEQQFVAFYENAKALHGAA